MVVFTSNIPAVLRENTCFRAHLRPQGFFEHDVKRHQDVMTEEKMMYKVNLNRKNTLVKITVIF